MQSKEPAEGKVDQGHVISNGDTAADLMHMEYPVPKWAIPDILPEGLALFGGKPKHGKSIIALNISLSIATGSTVLGAIESEQGQVVYFALEDTYRRLKNRLSIILQDTPAPTGLHLYTECPRMGRGGLEYLEEVIRQHNNQNDLRLVIIDTFARFRPIDNTKNKNPYDVDYADVAKTKRLADKYGVTILIIHHLRKSEADDVMDTFSGTLGLTGAADSLLALIRTTGQSDAELHVTGRDIEEAEYALRFDGTSLKWGLLDDVRNIKSTKQRQKLFDALRIYASEENPLTPKELAAIAGLDQQYVKNALPKLIKEGSAKKVDYGKYIYNSNFFPIDDI